MKISVYARNRIALLIIVVILACFVFEMLTELAKVPAVTTQLLSDEQRLRVIAATCSRLCDSEMNTLVFDKEYNQNYRYVPMPPRRCRAIYQNPYMFTASSAVIPPRHIPKELRASFSMNGRVQLRERYFNNAFFGSKRYVLDWTPSLMDEHFRQLRDGELKGSYGTKHTNEMFRLLQRIGIRGKRVLVVGSQRPWVETTALAAGAKETVTLEYGKIRASHPKMQAFTPDEFRSAYLSGNMPQFDVIVSYSTYEHSGLGRYGDALNPWADLIAVAMSWCVTKSDGLLVLQVPRARHDALAFNMHRYYGPTRLAHLTSNWVRVFRDDQNEWQSVLKALGDLSRPMVFKRKDWVFNLREILTTDFWNS